MKNTSHILVFFTGLICGLALISYIESNRRRKIALIRETLDNSFLTDTQNINIDALNLKSDFNKSFNAIV